MNETQQVKRARQQKVHRFRRCVPFLIPAMELLQSMYKDPERPKLTHHMLREKLQIPSYVSWVLLENLAKMRMFCLQLPNRRIIWDNDLLPPNLVQPMVEKSRREKQTL